MQTEESSIFPLVKGWVCISLCSTLFFSIYQLGLLGLSGEGVRPNARSLPTQDNTNWRDTSLFSLGFQPTNPVFKWS